MSRYLVQTRRFGLKKEGTRLTAETTPDKWYPIMSDVDVVWGPRHLADQAVRGRRAENQPVGGRKLGTLKFKMALDAQSIGEFLYSVMGAKSTAQQGSTAAYKHSFTVDTGTTPPAYTLFFDFVGAVKKYRGSCVKSLKFTGPMDGLIMVDVEVLFMEELDGSIGSPSFPTQRYLSFANTLYKIAGSDNLDVANWALTLDNGAFHDETINNSQLPNDILCTGPFMVSGESLVYFTSETERNKMLAMTGSAQRMLVAGATIEAPYLYTVDLQVTSALYERYPFDAEKGLLASKITWKGYDNGTSQFLADVTNAITAY
jgi:hypothetical protein